ncbi:MAG: type II secretion system F family protein [Actinomycetota bacterium]|nr:type II secretion system F family protein [Actinomycetota bacterium]
MGMNLLTAGVIAALLLTPQAAFAAEGDVEIKKIELRKWPAVSLVVYAKDGVRRDLAFTENSVAPSDVTFKPLADSDRDVEVVLVIDTSGSMAGEPLASATEAARTFISTVPPEVSVGVVTFATEPLELVRPTTDRAPVLRAVSDTAAIGETSLYDAVTAGVSLFGPKSQKNLIVLSDGADTTSANDLSAAIRAARRGRATVYAVGLNSPETDISALRRLARVGGGRYAPAVTADLSSIYRGLAARIEDQFVVSYKSVAEAGTELSLVVSSRLDSDVALALAPESERRVAPARPPEVDPDPLLEGALGLSVVLGSSFLAFFSLAWLLFGTATRRRRDRELAERMSAEPDRSSEPDNDSAAAWIPNALVDAAGRVADNRGWTIRIDRRLEQAQLALRAGEFIVLSVLAATAGVLVSALLLAPPVVLLIGAVGGGAIPFAYARLKAARRLKKLHGQLADILMVIASSLRAGHSFLQSLDAVAREIGDPGSYEFSRLVTEIRLGRSVDEALRELADRIGSEDLHWAILAVNIQREVGGNLAELLDTVAETIRERENVRRQVKVLSAEGRLSIYILAGLPFAILVYMLFVNPSYVGLLFTTRIGLVMSVVGASLMVLGIAWMRKVVKIDV